MTRDAEIPTIFGRRTRAPSVVVTGGDGETQPASTGAANPAAPGAGVPNGPYNSGPPAQVQHSDSLISNQTSTVQPEGGEQTQQGHTSVAVHKLKACGTGLCSKSARKIYSGVIVTVLVTLSWVGATHCIKYLYLRQPPMLTHRSPDSVLPPPSYDNVTIAIHPHLRAPYNAPFFTTWFCTNWTILFFPLYFLCRMISKRCQAPGEIFSESIRNYRDKGFTTARFLTRCSFFCMLWVATNYMYIHSLRILQATDVIALFATNVSCVYLLSWVILHEQFVGIRIVAVILCDTGIALLAYMDGITGSPTLGGVVLAASAAAGSAVYKVLFKKVIGDATYGQVAMFFSLIGMFNATLLWPLALALYFTGAETFQWERLPWPALAAASVLSLVANLLGNFSVALTYDLFITLGLITAVPVSAALDVVLYGEQFVGMKLAGMILIAVGFFLVMFPDNWPDYITRLLRNIIMLSHNARRHRHGQQGGTRRDIVDYRTGYIRSHLRSPSGRVR